MTWLRNPGHCPPEAAGKRVRVELANGVLAGLDPVSTVSPTGWSADGPSGCRTGHPFDIERYEAIK